MKPDTPATAQDLARDLQTFERLPDKTKELDLLKDRAEKAIGPESTALNQVIRTKSS